MRKSELGIKKVGVFLSDKLQQSRVKDKVMGVFGKKGPVEEVKHDNEE